MYPDREVNIQLATAETKLVISERLAGIPTSGCTQCGLDVFCGMVNEFSGGRHERSDFARGIRNPGRHQAHDDVSDEGPRMASNGNDLPELRKIPVP